MNAINLIRLKNKKRVKSQRTFSFTNKGALQLDCESSTILYVTLKLMVKYTKKVQVKMHRFLSKTIFLWKLLALISTRT